MSVHPAVPFALHDRDKLCKNIVFGRCNAEAQQLGHWVFCQIEDEESRKTHHYRYLKTAESNKHKDRQFGSLMSTLS